MSQDPKPTPPPLDDRTAAVVVAVAARAVSTLPKKFRGQSLYATPVTVEAPKKRWGNGSKGKQ